MGGKDTDYSRLFVSVFLTFYLLSFQICSALYNITRSQALSHGQTLLSPGRIFELGFFTPNNSQNQYVGIWYSQISPRMVVWVANRENPITITDSPARLMISDDGNLKLVDGNQNSVWSTNVQVPSNSSVVVLLDGGNLVLKDGKSGVNLWQSFDHLGDTLLPGALFGFNVKTGEREFLSSWKSESNPSPGNFTTELSQQRPPQIFVLLNGSSPIWRSGPWNRLRFTGMPRMGLSYRTVFDLVEDVEKGTTYLSLKNYNSSILSKMFVSSEGVMRLMSKEGQKDWYSICDSPSDPCEVYGACGPFGVCKISESDPICNCVKGFAPKSVEEWSKGNWTGGCVRETELLCEKSAISIASHKGNEDGFLKIEDIKLPDFYHYVEEYKDIDSCQKLCLNNCSCVAYAFVNGIGCLVWSESLIDIQVFSYGGEAIFVRLAHADLVGRHASKKIIIAVSTVSSVATLSLVFFIGLYRWRTSQKRKAKSMKDFDFICSRSDRSGSSDQISEQHDSSELPTFALNNILAATDYFNKNNKLGQGGFGPVYKGRLKDGTEIAVKRLSSSSGQGIQEFKNEVTLISKLQHRNLVRLIGCCVEKGEKILIYEFMPNKSLDYFLFDPRGRAQLDWATRFNIIHGVARGLVYLHRDSCLRVIHRDLKVSNILLDEKMNPKISDFGLARIFQGTLDLVNTHKIAGTLGYMSPEYAIGGIFSEKSDVFSFGVLILEIISGSKNTNFTQDDEHLSLIAYAWHLWSEGKGLLDLVDKALGDSYSSAEVIRCVHVGLLCVQDHAVDRPTMPKVVLMLSNEAELPHPKQPPFTFQSLFGSESQLPSESKVSMDEATTSETHEGQ